MMALCTTNAMATISHRDGTLKSLLESLKHASNVAPKRLILFHLDQRDYQEN
ncbi:MAG TPA: hypothetical protein HA279_05240 [Candidatus Poseidoniaceae archaeon]|nr:hypothetical protein [Candidatus Poseidoniaceae archaeon]